MHPLDNPIFQALTTTQAHFARVCNSSRKFLGEVSVLAGFPEPTPENYASLAKLLGPEERVGLFLPATPALPAGWTVLHSGALLQMCFEDHHPTSSEPVVTPNFTSLNQADVPEMMALAKLTKPGPFGTRTREMGDYIGIRVEGSLAAMAGERLRLPGCTEISAVCTHPDYLGRGYATGLIRVLIEQIIDRGEMPFLHVRQENVRAIQVYERLGFRQRGSFHYCYAVLGESKINRAS